MTVVLHQALLSRYKLRIQPPLLLMLKVLYLHLALQEHVLTYACLGWRSCECTMYLSFLERNAILPNTGDGNTRTCGVPLFRNVFEICWHNFIGLTIVCCWNLLAVVVQGRVLCIDKRLNLAYCESSIYDSAGK